MELYQATDRVMPKYNFNQISLKAVQKKATSPSTPRSIYISPPSYSAFQRAPYSGPILPQSPFPVLLILQHRHSYTPVQFMYRVTFFVLHNPTSCLFISFPMCICNYLEGPRPSILEDFDQTRTTLSICVFTSSKKIPQPSINLYARPDTSLRHGFTQSSMNEIGKRTAASSPFHLANWLIRCG
jgi:hypothetical protein